MRFAQIFCCVFVFACLPAVAAPPSKNQAKNQTSSSAANRAAQNRALLRGAEIGSLTAVQAAIRSGADPNLKLEHGIGLLYAMAAGGQTDTVRLLLDKGANIEGREESGDTPLIVAAQGNWRTVKLLLERGANPNARTQTGMTPLIYASGGGDEKIVMLLLNKGAKVNMASADGLTPLMAAAYGSNSETVVKILLKHGANVRPIRHGTQTALSFAKENGHTEAEALLRAAGAK